MNNIMIVDVNPTYAAMQPLLNPQGEIDITGFNFSERIQQFAALRDKAGCNLPLLESSILTQIPMGVGLLPMVVIPQKSDAWRGEDARKMQLKEGMVEPSADFMQKICNMMDVKLVKTYEGPRDIGGVEHYSVRYNAYMTLPNGAVLSVEDEGKDQPVNNRNGVQAHIVESTRRKAKRNAIKALLGIPTTMPEKDFDRPWVLLRPVFHAGFSKETDAILAEKKLMAEKSREILYPALTGDVKTEVTVDISELAAAIQVVKTKEELEVVGKRIAAARLSGDERIQLGGLYRQRSKELEPALSAEGGF